MLTSKIKERGIALQANLDRDWKDRADLDSAWEQMRLERIMSVTQLIPVQGKSIVDLGCGRGDIAVRLQQSGATVLAVDLSDKALALLKEKYNDQVMTRQDLIPYTNLEDDKYDIVISTDVIAEIDAREHPVYMSELYRLMKPEGRVICSTPVDVYSVDATQRFRALAERDFIVHTWRYSYHRLLIQLVDRIGFLKGLKRSKRAIAALEWLSQLMWGENAISHAIFIGERRSLNKRVATVPG